MYIKMDVAYTREMFQHLARLVALRGLEIT